MRNNHTKKRRFGFKSLIAVIATLIFGISEIKYSGTEKGATLDLFGSVLNKVSQDLPDDDYIIKHAPPQEDLDSSVNNNKEEGL